MATVRSESSGASCAWPVSIPRPELAGHHPPRSPCSRAEGRVPSPSPGHRLSLGRTASPLARFPKPKTDSRMEVEGISGPTQCGGRRVPDVTTGVLAGRVEARPVPRARCSHAPPPALPGPPFRRFPQNDRLCIAWEESRPGPGGPWEAASLSLPVNVSLRIRTRVLRFCRWVRANPRNGLFFSLVVS